jgi:hypothetical protein
MAAKVCTIKKGWGSKKEKGACKKAAPTTGLNKLRTPKLYLGQTNQ